jgi:hypothetical protein
VSLHPPPLKEGEKQKDSRRISVGSLFVVSTGTFPHAEDVVFLHVPDIALGERLERKFLPYLNTSKTAFSLHFCRKSLCL